MLWTTGPRYLSFYPDQIEDIWLYQCKIDFYFTNELQKQYFTSGEATSENTAFDVHEWNKKTIFHWKSQIFYFFYA